MRQSNQAKVKERMDLDLSVAARDGSTARAQELLSAGADVEARDNANWTPILSAARGGHTEIVKMLLERGANPNVVEHGNGNMTPLIWAAALDNLECVQMLLDHGADVNASTTQGYTALMQAAQNGTPGTVKVLLDHGANLGNQGRTALEIAKANRSVASRVDVTTLQTFTNPVSVGKAEKRHDEIIQILQAREGKE
jgi:ankyrin repeat protein